MATRVADDVREDIADVITTHLGSGGFIRVYTGTLDSALDPTGDTLLAEFPLTNPAAAAAIAGVATFDFDPDLSDTVIATGTPGWWIGVTSGGVAKVGGDVSTSGASLNFDNVSWVIGGTVNLTTGTATAPATD